MDKYQEITAWPLFLCAALSQGLLPSEAAIIADKCVAEMKARYEIKKSKLAEAVPITHTVNGVSLLPPDTRPKSK